MHRHRHHHHGRKRKRAGAASSDRFRQVLQFGQAAVRGIHVVSRKRQEAKEAKKETESKHNVISIAFELKRQEAYQDLEHTLRRLCQALTSPQLRQEPSQSFQRWHQAQSLVPKALMRDALIPSCHGEFDKETYQVDSGLMHELQKLYVNRHDAKQICQDLAAKSHEKALMLQSLSLEDGDDTCHIQVIESPDTQTWILSGHGHKFLLTDARFQQLRKECLVFSSSSSSSSTTTFQRALFQVLLRYSTLKGTGYQMAIGETVFHTLVKDFAIERECFASPLNHRLASYGSAFFDTDRWFNSQGSFFDFYPEQGSFEVNPPFLEEILIVTVLHMIYLLEKADQKELPLSFIVFSPAWDDTPGNAQMEKSPFLRYRRKLEKKRHVYLRGNQHELQDAHMLAGADSYITILQTSAGARKWPAEDDKLDRLFKSFTVGIRS